MKKLPEKKMIKAGKSNKYDKNIDERMQEFYNEVEGMTDFDTAYSGVDSHSNLTKLCDNLRFASICKENGLFEKYPPKIKAQASADGKGIEVFEKNLSGDRLNNVEKMLQANTSAAGKAMRENAFGYALGKEARQTNAKNMTAFMINRGPTEPNNRVHRLIVILGHSFPNMYSNRSLQNMNSGAARNMDFSKGFSADLQPMQPLKSLDKLETLSYSDKVNQLKKSIDDKALTSEITDKNTDTAKQITVTDENKGDNLLSDIMTVSSNIEPSKSDAEKKTDSLNKRMAERMTGMATDNKSVRGSEIEVPDKTPELQSQDFSMV